MQISDLQNCKYKIQLQEYTKQGYTDTVCQSPTTSLCLCIYIARFPPHNTKLDNDDMNEMLKSHKIDTVERISGYGAEKVSHNLLQ